MSENITNNPSVPTQIVSEVKFPRFINNLGIIPTSYKDSMSYYETLAWLCKYLEETVIPTVNQNGEAVQELQALFIQLNNYVTHYFDNLDVQEEINNKLDDMVDQGTLQEIIGDYLNANALWSFDNVTDMKNSTNLINGSFAKTLGFYEKNDGGTATYKIRNITNDDVIDNMFIIPLNDETNQLIAELIEKNININQLGAYGDGVHDDTTIFEKAIEKLDTLSLVENKTYIVKNLVIDKYFNLFGNNAILKANEECNYILKLTTSVNSYNGIIKNIIFDGNQKANDCVLLDNNFRRVLENITLNNPIENGLKAQNACGGTRITSINGSQSNIGHGTFLNIQGADININMADFQNYKTGLYSSSNLFIDQFHGYIFTQDSSLLNDTKFIDMEGGRLIASNVYPDTQNFWFYIGAIGDYQIKGGNSWHNDVVNDTIIAGTTSQKVYCVYAPTSLNARRFHLTNFAINTPSTIENIEFTNITGILLDTTSTNQSFDSKAGYSDWLNTSYSIINNMATINTNETNNLRFKNSGTNKGQIFGTITFSNAHTDVNTITILTLSEYYQFSLNSALSFHDCVIGTDYNSASHNDVKLEISGNKITLHKLRATDLSGKILYINDYINIINVK